MEELLGLLRIHVNRGVNLAVRNVRTSDPYIIFGMGNQSLKTEVIDRDVNPVWDEDLTLSIRDLEMPIQLTVYDCDRFSSRFNMDDEMGDAEFDINTFIEDLRMDYTDFPDGTILAKQQPSRQNCLAEASTVILREGKDLQTFASD
ncbi:protein C2-DOMAIN ABA-RELATED 4-like [Hibiscus syriacus]|uniref:protein C2-DOMAIN ABA-RELATED 4-like n=1 Tax=Hibiscus syriacus TaxID=106335 RepID=UPI0019240C2D|nr:protein C2-DOMAIN ABA-RELATED 4-like [Hibiscus syriacus]